MFKQFLGADPAYTAAVTVILLLVLIIEMTYIAVIVPKNTVTVFTSLLSLLNALALQTLDLCDLEAIHLMGFLVVMAKATNVKFTAARSPQLAASGIVLTAACHLHVPGACSHV